MEHITEKKAKELLKKYSTSEENFQKVLEHSSNVRLVALEVADKVPDIDKQFISTAALLHDIGRFNYPPGTKDSIRHGIEGARILREEGLIKHALVAERHIGIGISADEIEKQDLNLPKKDYVPQSKEEMIITYADNLDYKGRQTEQFVEDRFAREIGESYRERVKEFHNKINTLCRCSKKPLSE